MLERGVRRRPRASTVELLATALGLDAPQRQALVRAAGRQAGWSAPEAPVSQAESGDSQSSERGAGLRIDVAPPPDGGRIGAVPRELPRPPVDFTGRARELAVLRGLFDPEPGGSAEAGSPATRRGRPVSIAMIDGMAGAGKSALAIHAAHLLADAGAFPDGQLYLNLQGASPGHMPLSPLDGLGRMLRSLGMDPIATPGQVDEAASRFRSLVAGRRLLVVLDNARGAEQVRPLLPGSPTCGVLVTSRQVLSTVEGAQVLHVDTPSSEDALELLGRIVGVDRVEAEPEAAAEVVRWCGYLPLAVRIAGARLAARPRWSIRELAEQLADATDRLETLQSGDLALRASFDASLHALEESSDPVDQAALAAFGLLSLPDGPDLGLTAAVNLLDQPEASTQELLERLVDAQLLESPRPGRYQFHDLVRAHARDHAAQRYTACERTHALTRLIGFYTATAWRTLALLRPGDRRAMSADPRWSAGGLTFADVTQAVTWLEAERANLLAAITQAQASAGYEIPLELPVQLSRALFGFFVVGGYLNDWAEANRAAVALAQRIGDRAGEASAQTDLGTAYEWLGRYTDAMACQQESLAIFRELGDHDGEAGSLNNLGLVYERLGRFEDAIACHQESLAIFRELDNRRGQASSLNNLGVVYGRVGRCDEAIVCLRESLGIFRDLSAGLAQANTLRELGVVYGRLSRHSEAIARHRESLGLFRTLGASLGQANTLQQLGVVYGIVGRHEEAVACLQDSLTLFRDLSARGSQTRVLRDLGDALLLAGRESEARLVWHEGLEIGTMLQIPEVDEIRARLE